MLAYAVSYDWYQGREGMKHGYPNKIMLHAMREEEVDPELSNRGAQTQNKQHSDFKVNANWS